MSKITVDAVSKTYPSSGGDIRALDTVSFTIEPGEFCVLAGEAGCGKTTLMHLLAAMDGCDSGTIQVGEHTLAQYNRQQLIAYRAKEIGVLLAQSALLPTLNVLDNVLFAGGVDQAQATDMLKRVGLGEHLKKYPAKLTLAQSQCAALARALAKNPRVLLCDEPLARLEYAAGKSLLQLVWDLTREREITVLWFTHNTAIAPVCNRLILLRNGRVRQIAVNDNPVPVEKIDW